MVPTLSRRIVFGSGQALWFHMRVSQKVGYLKTPCILQRDFLDLDEECTLDAKVYIYRISFIAMSSCMVGFTCFVWEGEGRLICVQLHVGLYL